MKIQKYNEAAKIVLSVAAMLGVLIFVVMQSGCTAAGPQFNGYAAKLPKPKVGDGRIWVYRESGIFGAAVQPPVFLNGEKVGRAQPGGFFYADRPAGAYRVECTTEFGWTHKCEFTLADQSVKYVQLFIVPGVFEGHLLPREVEEEEALKELRRLHLIEKKK